MLRIPSVQGSRVRFISSERAFVLSFAFDSMVSFRGFPIPAAHGRVDFAGAIANGTEIDPYCYLCMFGNCTPVRPHDYDRYCFWCINGIPHHFFPVEMWWRGVPAPPGLEGPHCGPRTDLPRFGSGRCHHFKTAGFLQRLKDKMLKLGCEVETENGWKWERAPTVYDVQALRRRKGYGKPPCTIPPSPPPICTDCLISGASKLELHVLL